MINLDPWQKQVLDYNGDLLLCTGRRVGKTYILARKAVDKMASKKIPVVIISLTEDQAMIIMSMALNYAKERYFGMIGRGLKKPTMKSLTFTNGSKMIVRPVGNTGDGARGFEGGILIVDEAARMPKMFWIAAKPILLTTNGQIWMGSTPFGEEGYFWEQFNDAHNKKNPDARFRVFYISSEEAILNRPVSSSWTEEQKQGAIRILEREKKEMTETEYGQEYLGLFMHQLQRFFSDDLIESCCILKRREQISGRLYLGSDIAGLGEDLTTIEIIDKINKDNYEHVENISFNNTFTTDVSERIIKLHEQLHFKKIGIDDGGIGFGVFSELLRNDKTRKRVIALNNASRAKEYDKDDKKKIRLLKEEMYINLKVLMEQKRIKLLNDEDLIDSLRGVQWELVIKDGEKTKTRIFGKKSHITEGLIRAVQLAYQDKGLNIWVASKKYGV